MFSKNIMTKSPVFISMDDSLATVRDIFTKENFHHILVVEQSKLVGVVSDRDYLKSVNITLGTPIETKKDLAALNKRVHQIMSRNIITVSPQASLTEVVNIFHSKKVSCIPVVNESNFPIGIISWKDIIRAIAVYLKQKQ